MDNRDASRDGLTRPPGGARAEQVAALFREHHRALLAFLQCRLPTAADAQEVAQEVYLRLLALGEEARIETPRAFLFRVAANLAVDRARMQAVRARAPADPEPEDWHAAPLPEQHAAALQQWQDIRAALRELPAKTSRAFVMHAIEGRDYPAVARAMGLSERMVRYHVSHAINHCRARCNRTETP
jgi:RNA polymerase sigma-70 factor (ECF subfamily)